MSEQPSIEQQLAEVIYDDLLLHDIEFAKTRSKRIADAIVAAVNEGRCPPIVPEGACVCGEPLTLGVVHRLDGPCFHYDDAVDQLIAGPGLVQRLREEAERIDGDGGWWEKAPLMREAADRIEQQDAELAELRALKAKVDGLHATLQRNWMDELPAWWSAPCGALLAWLREANDG